MQEQNTIIEATPFQRATAATNKQGFKLKPLPTAIGITFLLLAAAIAFLFLARAVKIEMTPAADDFSFTSGFTYELGGRYLMLTGDYTFTATKTGYQTLSASITVNQSPDQTYPFEMLKLPGILHITTNPPSNSEIFIDQLPVGNTPLEIDHITPGLHDIRIQSARYLDYNTEISIEGKRLKQELVVPLSQGWANISLDSNPAGAEIFIDDLAVSKTPAVVEAIRGSRNIQLKKKGYKTWQTSIVVEAESDQQLASVILEKSDGSLSIRSEPAGANININGNYRGQTPVKLILEPGKQYNVQLSRAGYQPLKRSLSLQPEEDLMLTYTLLPILGIVQLMVEPADSTLYVDNKAYNDPSLRLSLTVKQHEIRVEKPGYASYSTRITPQPGATQQLFIRLQTEAEARVAAIETELLTGIGQTLKLILPAEFDMGAGRREPGRRSNEISKHVQLTRPYYLSDTEVTNKQYKLYDPFHESGIVGRAMLSEDDRPAVNLSWQDAVAFCNWLSSKDNLPLAYEQVAGKWQAVLPMNSGYRLPTEAEWAFAARYASGPEPRRFPWGDTMPPLKVEANYADESAISMVAYHINNYNDSYRGTSPVKVFPANELGIYGLAGNVAEWLHDYYSVDNVKDTLIDPFGPEYGDYHVIRGASYLHGRFSELRWTYREYGDQPRVDVGFRIGRYLQ
ncbi:MAG: PEGA domain-containing protein [Pseudomonadales bacterium]|nr:PEGA domain-containing protein [Pseudomonadales bacterium]